MKPEDLEFLRELGRRLLTQDGRATADPLYQIERRERIYGIDPSYRDPDGWSLRDESGEEIATTKNRPGGGDYADAVPHLEHWEPVAGKVALTEVGAQEYLDVYGHNLNHPRIYVGSAYRVPEMIRLRQVLMNLAREES